MTPKSVGSRPIIALASALLLAMAAAYARAEEPVFQCPTTTGALYARIRSVGLDPHRVYSVRGASIDRASLHIDLDDGTLAFTEDVCGRITGAFFAGDGEVRLRPPNPVERGSLALFTGMAILDEQFASGYLRFNDDTVASLLPFLRPASDGAEFVKKWDDASRNLAEFDALRLLLDFSHFLPAPGAAPPDRKFPSLLHAHLLGKKLGAFEVFWDALALEPLSAGQARIKGDVPFFDIWTSFAPRSPGVAASSSLTSSSSPPPSSSLPASDVSIAGYRIQAWVQPPTRLRASTEVQVRIRDGGERALLFELSRYLKIDAVEADGRPVDFIQNPAMEGTVLRRKGNDQVMVVFPASLAAGQVLKLRFGYDGEVLSEAGNGLLYVGERGTWYPSFGLSPAQFDMEFHYPTSWMLVATGKQVVSAAGEDREKNSEAGTENMAIEVDAKASERPSEKVSRWTSTRPIPVAGFNLGKYVRAQARVGNILVEAYGTRGVEKTFPKAPPESLDLPRSATVVVNPPSPSPARDAQAVADKAAKAIVSFSQWFGPFPYSSLALTQMPGNLSQGWPGMVFLSSLAFLSPREQVDLHFDPLTRELNDLVLVHETAHQWWGDLVLWRSYRDQWIAEGLANYAALLLLEQTNPEQFHQVLEKYRHDLLSKNDDGEWLRAAGPVTLGQRLESSHFPRGYEEISYERGTWLLHMLRCMFRDAALRDSSTSARSRKARLNPDEPFFRALRKIRERYAGKRISTEDLIQAFEEELPRPLWYEHRHKLDWFVEGWIEGTAIPRLETRDVRIAEKSGATTVTGTIVQKDAPDDLVTAVPIYATTAANTLVFLGEVLADGPETQFRMTAPAGVRKIELDPKQTILTAPK